MPETQDRAVSHAGALSAVWKDARAVYVHVPFCLHRCGYCDFTLVANRDHLIPDYLSALENELSASRTDRGPSAGPIPVETIFVGGGTPTHLAADQLSFLLQLIAQHFVTVPGGEYSFEANPDGLSDEKLLILQAAGVNRISLGVQSFDQSCLQTLERRHSAEQAIRAIERCHSRFPAVSLDLIFAVPGQSAETWTRTLQLATTLPVQHLSTYGLTYEQGTPFFRNERSGMLVRLPDEIERQMYLEGIDRLTAAGYEHYEVSNFAKPGFRCRHNYTYWRAEPYYGFGPGAARYLHGVRTTNSRRVGQWIRNWLQQQPCLHESEQLSEQDRAREAIMLALRMIDGLDLADFQQRFSRTAESLAGEAIARHVRNGLLQQIDGRLRLTRDGLLLADTVVVDFL